jgi:peptide deformylase
MACPAALYRPQPGLHSGAMSILKIARMGHPVLARPAQMIEDPTAPEIRRLADDMLETMMDAKGTGLAAPQVYAPLRLVIFFVGAEPAPGEDEDGEAIDEDDLEVPLTLLINPVLEPLGEEMEFGSEGCLSLPGLIGAVPRYRRLRYRGLTLDGEILEREAEGFHARVVQHECDHLDGILYPQRMTDLSTLMFTSEIEAAAIWSEKERRAVHDL